MSDIKHGIYFFQYLHIQWDLLYIYIYIYMVATLWTNFTAGKEMKPRKCSFKKKLRPIERFPFCLIRLGEISITTIFYYRISSMNVIHAFTNGVTLLIFSCNSRKPLSNPFDLSLLYCHNIIIMVN